MHAGLNPARLAKLLERSDLPIVVRMRALRLHESQRRSPHRAAPRLDGGLTPAMRSTVRRADQPPSPTAPAALADRLDVPVATIQRLAGRPASSPPAEPTAARRVG
jgi:hypothetical protein